MFVDRDVDWYACGLMQHWHPSYAYVMDIARTPDGFKLIEYNCINASGFYACDCNDIVWGLVNLVEDADRGWIHDGDDITGEKPSRGILI